MCCGLFYAELTENTKNCVSLMIKFSTIIAEKQKGDLVMIEIIREECWDDTQEKMELPKNIKQIGTPDIGDRIYIENETYQLLHPYRSREEKSVYVLLGRFENYVGRQCTFVEAAVCMEEIPFEGNLPQWNDETWAYLYRKFKKEYDEMVIVGWAMDIRGQLPNITAPLEKMHRIYFGGTHQILFLMDTLEQEECFYSLKNNYLSRREGFYIYYDPSIPTRLNRAMEAIREEKEGTSQPTERRTVEQEMRMRVEQEMKQGGRAEGKQWASEEEFAAYTDWNVEEEKEAESKSRSMYRDYLKAQNEKKAPKASYASTFLLLAVVIALGMAALQNNEKMKTMEQTIAQMNGQAPYETEEQVENNSETANKEIAVENIKGNLVAQGENAQIQGDSQTSSEAQPQDTTQTEGITSVENPTQTESVTSVENTTQTENTASSENTQSQETTQAGSAMETEAVTTTANTYIEQGYYIVQEGESLAGICQKIYQTSAMLDKICEANGIDNPDEIYAGQYLELPN